ncbi:hypothetical protein DL93DRAFT_2089268 [Clavulina sp. PMI_390]|nr:hypothetical protein DL93DRAFT_2089268 [Clavulina sp. PMI_390]
MIAFALVFVPLMVALPSAGIDSMHYGSTGAWCWINVPSSFRGSRVPIAIMRALSDYVWVWGASLICFICYGYIVFRWWWQAERAIGRVKDALVLLWYPVAYFIEIFPQTVINFAVTTAALRHATGHPHPAFFVVSNILFASSGWINVLLWVWTGRQFGFTDESARPAGADEEAEVSVPLTQRGSTRAPAGAAGGNQTDGTRTPREGISLHSHSASSSSFMSSTASSSFQPRHTRNLSSTDSGGGGGGYNDPYENTSYDPYAYAYPTSATSASHPHSFPNTHNDNDSSPSHSLSPPTTRKPLNSPTTRNSNSPYSYPGPSFPGDDNFESPEHAELARTVPDYGGEEFWRQTPSDPDPVLGNVGTSANASTSTHTAGATVGGRPTSAAFGGKAFPLRRQTAGHIQTPISAERDEWGVEGGLR